LSFAQNEFAWVQGTAATFLTQSLTVDLGTPVTASTVSLGIPLRYSSSTKLSNTPLPFVNESAEPLAGGMVAGLGGITGGNDNGRRRGRRLAHFGVYVYLQWLVREPSDHYEPGSSSEKG